MEVCSSICAFTHRLKNSLYLWNISVVEPGRKAWHLIKKEFGDTVFHKDGQLNREILGEIIFDNVEKRKKLNEITHPEIYSEMFWAAVRCFFQGK